MLKKSKQKNNLSCSIKMRKVMKKYDNYYIFNM
jgi:hypothetical protein